MRILIWSPMVSLGGGGRLLLNLSKAIARQDDIELVRLVVPPKTRLKEMVNPDSYPNIDIMYSKENSVLEGSNVFLQDCHVVYYFWPHGLAYRKADRPSVCTFHDTTILDHVPPFTLGSQIKQYWEDSQVWLQNCTSVVAPSNYVQSRLSAIFGYDDASVIHHAILLENEQTSKYDGLTNLPRNYIVYPANTSPHKNHHNLLLAYSKFTYRKEYPLVLFGYLTDLLRSQPPNWPEIASIPTLVSLIKRVGLRIDEDIYPMGFIDDSAIVPRKSVV